MKYEDDFLDYPGEFDDNSWGRGPMNDNFSPPRKKPFFGNPRDNRYNNAYGAYRGGYGPGGGFGPGGPPGFFGPPPGPFPLMGPPVPPGPLGLPFQMGRGFGPGGPRKKSQHKAIKYLQRCGVDKEHLRNLPDDLLDLIEPEHCGLCAVTLESFPVSKIHYMSKNHLKNQRKWLLKGPTESSFKSREIPIKSRDLYCELCDVHITSKVHADSHYSGKAHIGIVDGRKLPKNPFLLQPGMKARVDQLIRREKRHLKTQVDENVIAEEPKETGKPIPSEFICEICNTTVTCSEQMTMHLNGKRHLSKEKHHILNMMKIGNKDAATENESMDNAGTNVGKGAEGGAEENKNGEENEEDWENGDGNWDEKEKN